MTKAMLSRRGVEFDALDVENDPRALEQLRALGLSSVPAVVVGDRMMTGWNPTQLAEVVGFSLQEQTGTPEDLLSSLRVVLDAPLRELARHLFHVVEAGVDADVLGVFPATAWLEARDVPTLSGATLLTRYGEAVRAKFHVWYESAPPDPVRFARSVEADVGPRTLAQVLERTRLHAAQHLRQLYAFLAWLGVTPDEPVTDDELRKLGLRDLPDEVF